MNEFGVLGGNWDPINKKFSSVNSYGQDLLPTCKAFPKETTTKNTLRSWVDSSKQYAREGQARGKQ